MQPSNVQQQQFLKDFRVLYGMRGELSAEQRALVEKKATELGIAEAPKSTGNFVTNMPRSLGNLVSGMGQAIRHPGDTMANMAGVALGVAEKVIPGRQEHEGFADALGELYTQRYGSVEKAYETFHQDPAGFLSDVAGVLTLGGGTAAKTGLLANKLNMPRVAAVANKTAQIARTGAAWTDPVNVGIIKPIQGMGKGLSRVGSPLNAGDRDAVEWALSRTDAQGAPNPIPVPADIATGNRFMQIGRKAAEHTLGGSFAGGQGRKHLSTRMEETGRELAAQGAPGPNAPRTPLEAGASVRGELTNVEDAHFANAELNYGPVWALENDPRHTRTVKVGMKDIEVTNPSNPSQKMTIQVPDMKPVKLPVNIEGLKQQLKPIYQHMQQWWKISKRNDSSAFVAIKSVMESPDHVPASVVEKALGGLKEMSREGGRDAATGLAKHMIPKVQKLVDDTVMAADSSKLQMLQDGRKSTALGHEVIDVKKRFNNPAEEPVQDFTRATWTRDTNIEFLKDVHTHAPGELPKIGRAWLENTIDQATAGGSQFNATKTLANGWDNLGTQQKQLMFPNPAHRQDLDRFFTLIKKQAENANPSGTSYATAGLVSGAAVATDVFWGLLGNVGTYGVVKLMYSPKAVKLLLDGVRLPPGSAEAASFVRKLSMLAARATQPAGAAASAATAGNKR